MKKNTEFFVVLESSHYLLYRKGKETNMTRKQFFNQLDTDLIKAIVNKIANGSPTRRFEFHLNKMYNDSYPIYMSDCVLGANNDVRDYINSRIEQYGFNGNCAIPTKGMVFVTMKLKEECSAQEAIDTMCRTLSSINKQTSNI